MATVQKKSNRKASVMDDFIKLVESEMVAQEISLSELARMAAVGRPYLHRVLSKEQVPSVEWVEKVAGVLGINLVFEVS